VQHQRFGQTTSHGSALDAKWSEDQQTTTLDIYVSHGYAAPGWSSGSRKESSVTKPCRRPSWRRR
jgi:hypothetical protein